MTNNYILYRHILRKEVSGYKYDKYYYGITKQKFKSRCGKNGNGYHKNKKFMEDINKFNWVNIEHEILFKNLTKEEAELLERLYIALYNTTNNLFGYNKLSGGYNLNDKTNHPMYGKHHSEESRNKMRERKIGNSNAKGHKVSNNAKKEMSKKRKGKYVGDRHPQAKKVKCITTGEIFTCVKYASEKYNVNKSNISACCRGERNYAGKHPITGEKLFWKYIDD